MTNLDGHQRSAESPFITCLWTTIADSKRIAKNQGFEGVKGVRWQ